MGFILADSYMYIQVVLKVPESWYAMYLKFWKIAVRSIY